MKHISLIIAVIFLSLLCFNANAQDVGNMVQQKPFAISGSLGLGLGTYEVSGIPARQRDFSYIFNGAPVMSVYGVSFPFSVVVSDQQRSYTQPFNQYGISPTYKWLTVHAGWRSLEWSPYTLAGHNFLGGGVELNPGKLRLGFIYGRFNKAIEQDPLQPLALAQQPAYKRTGYSLKLGYGTEQNHVDLTYLHSKDDIHSLSSRPDSGLLNPAENMVLGLSTRFGFLKHFVFDADVSGSIYTNNLLSDTLKNLELGEVAFIKSLIKLNSSTQLSTAAQTSIGYNATAYNIKLRYSRIDPDYKSMGAYYFETDAQNFTIESMVKLIQGQMQVSGSFGVQKITCCMIRHTSQTEK
jgi:hypothetical protein